MQPQMAVVLALSEGTSIITESIFENRFKYVDELFRMGGQIKVEGNTAIIDGVEGFVGANIVAPDLRAGAALVIAGLVADGFTVVEDIKYILRGYEKFDEKIRALGGQIAVVETEKEIQKFKLKVS
jgi:UDP-N-acetylglucosamine 1-carboxyvinyltransferase